MENKQLLPTTTDPLDCQENDEQKRSTIDLGSRLASRHSFRPNTT